MRILVATDAWHPQINGVVQTYGQVSRELERLGTEVVFLTPAVFRTLPCPAYPEIRLALPRPSSVARFIEETQAQHIHVATEGPIGLVARRYCLGRGLPFTTAYHTKFPEYVSSLLGLPQSWTYGAAKRFHNAGTGTMVATPSLAADLAARGFRKLMPWTRGVDTDHFRPRASRLFGSDVPTYLYVGRVSKEKNIEAFLDADLPGRKVVTGDGPQLAQLRQRYPDVLFTGARQGEELADIYASADVFVFPSRTDTFGLVLLEAMASGLPVAAYPVTGPVDVVADGVAGVLDQDLARAARAALTLDRGAVRRHAMTFSWASTAALFLENVRAAHAGALQPRSTPLRHPRSGSRNVIKKLAALAAP